MGLSVQNSVDIEMEAVLANAQSHVKMSFIGRRKKRHNEAIILTMVRAHNPTQFSSTSKTLGWQKLQRTFVAFSCHQLH